MQGKEEPGRYGRAPCVPGPSPKTIRPPLPTSGRPKDDPETLSSGLNVEPEAQRSDLSATPGESGLYTTALIVESGSYLDS